MHRRWLRPVLVITAAAAALLGAGVLLVPRHADKPAPASAPASSELDRYVTRTTDHLTKVPGDWQGWAQLGMAQVQLARITADPSHYPPAETALRRSLTVQPHGNAAALTGLGALAAARHNFHEAFRYAHSAVATDAFSADAYGVLTDACVELGRYPEATAAVQRMLDLRPDTGSFGRASYVFELSGNRNRATELMQRALDVAGSPADATFALTHLGELAFNEGDLDKAAGYFARGLARTPGQPALLADRAKVSAARGDYASALDDLRAATAVLPTVDHLVTLSDTLTAAGRPGEAATIDTLIRATTRLPGATGATTDIDLVLFYADRGEPGTAVAKARALFAARPSVSVETAYAWALHAAGRDREALTHADRGLRLGTKDARAHYQRAQIRRALGDRRGARADLSEALALNPYFSLRNAPRARTELASLEGPA
ncbi:tetratricopeptide repeat protein [Actinoplanes sp. TFC3]|uniref:tetratricopeptide repeat protein n=1 Tax=Actinoplanes sp. TFC3 TaxID=1710355 RepID=UPI001F295549|nr:tetratricopeptide repeat protein [Actinoplanes sp. TFC3]